MANSAPPTPPTQPPSQPPPARPQAQSSLAQQTAAPPAARSRSISALHKDIEFANTYRLELIKTMLAIATALLAFTVSFRPRLTQVTCESAMVLGWAGLAISLIAGLATMYGWERFYISYRDFDWKGLHDEGKAHRRTVNGWRKLAFALQCCGFLAGVAGVATFAALNVGNVRVDAAAQGLP